MMEFLSVKLQSLQRSGSNFALKRTHHMFFSEYVLKTRIKRIKRENAFF